MLLAAAAAVAVALVLVFVVFTGGSKHRARRHSTASHTATTGASASTTAANGIKLLAQVNLDPPNGGTKPIGLAAMVVVDKKDALVIRAQDLAPNSAHPVNHYAVWLSNSPSQSLLVGVVKQPVGKNGELETGGGLPPTASHYRQLLLTLETTTKPKKPGRAVLEGTRSAGF